MAPLRRRATTHQNETTSLGWNITWRTWPCRSRPSIRAALIWDPGSGTLLILSPAGLQHHRTKPPHHGKFLTESSRPSRKQGRVFRICWTGPKSRLSGSPALSELTSSRPRDNPVQLQRPSWWRGALWRPFSFLQSCGNKALLGGDSELRLRPETTNGKRPPPD